MRLNTIADNSWDRRGGLGLKQNMRGHSLIEESVAKGERRIHQWQIKTQRTGERSRGKRIIHDTSTYPFGMKLETC